MAAWLSDEDARRSRFVISSTERHADRDWGQLAAEDARANDAAARRPGSDRILSSFRVPEALGGGDLWILTERDGSVTTVLQTADN